jgi:hypothetical protein
VDDDHLVAVHRIVDFELSGLDDKKVDFGVAGAEDGFPVRILAGISQLFDLCDLRIG